VVTASETAMVVAEMLASEMLRERPGQMGGGRAASARWRVAWVDQVAQIGADV
jgi:hypothetical protein